MIYKGSCCGNSFIIYDCRKKKLSHEEKSNLAKENISKYKVDSALFIEKSLIAKASVKIFEKDGSESDFCGNGVMLISFFLGMKKGNIKMKNGMARVNNADDRISIVLGKRKIEAQKIKNEKNCYFVEIGEPHLIYIVDDVVKFDLDKAGHKMQEHYPKGVNVDAVQQVKNDFYLIRTYERGVFAETKACGTGSMSSYVAVSNFFKKNMGEPVKLRSIGGVHKVSSEKNRIKLETKKEYCCIEPTQSK